MTHQAPGRQDLPSFGMPNNHVLMINNSQGTKGSRSAARNQDIFLMQSCSGDLWNFTLFPLFSLKMLWNRFLSFGSVRSSHRQCGFPSKPFRRKIAKVPSSYLVVRAATALPFIVYLYSIKYIYLSKSLSLGY